ncbi:hypothetical protein [Nonlabens ulvanivorans]|uniref:hypothetical protein n=1 Tax=Nonlabens ulvanivorans TaxID=906888 RepID=UPI0037CB8404
MIKSSPHCNLITALFLIFSFVHFNLFAQSNQSIGFTLPEVIKSSPTTSSLMSIEELDVNQYTGQPNIDLPLFNKKILDLNYNLALRYNSSGIRVKELSGWVGTGWSLETGGAISRSVIGLPDELEDLNKNLYGINKLPNTGNGIDFYDLGEITQGPFQYINHDNEFYFNALWGKNVELDTGRDIYQFNFFGYSGRFVFVSNGNGGIETSIIGSDVKLIISTGPLNSNGEIDYFKVTDPKGNVFFFSAIETTTKQTGNFSKFRDGTSSIDVKDPITFRSAWKLTSVENSFGVELISFEYDAVNEMPNRDGFRWVSRTPLNCRYSEFIEDDYLNKSSNTGTLDLLLMRQNMERHARAHIEWLNSVRSGWLGASDNSISIPLGGGGSGGDSGGVSCPNAPQGCEYNLEPMRTTSLDSISVNSQKVKRVEFLDNTIIDFSISNTHPEYQGWVLNNFIVKQESNPNQIFEFKYNDTYRNNSSNPNLNDSYTGKLYLDQIIKSPNLNSSLVEKYEFSYTPPILQNSLDDIPSDPFGYYFSGIEENHSTDVLKGVLKSIKYPTGGFKKFNWESNRYSFIGDRLLSYDEILLNPDNYTLSNQNITSHTSRMELLIPNSNAIVTPSNNPTKSTPVTVFVPQDQYVDIEYRSLSSPYNYLHWYNYFIYIEPIDSTGQIDNTRETVFLDMRSFDGPIVENAFLEMGHYNVYIAQNPLESSVIGVDYNIMPTTLDVEVELNVKVKYLKEGPLNWFLYGGGVRIVSVEDQSENSTKRLFNYDYSLEGFEFNNADFTYTNDGFPIPDDYPGNPSVLGPLYPTHIFSSGSLDGESNLNRSYFYRKYINSVPDNSLNGFRAYYFVLEHQDELSSQLTHGNYIGYKNVAEINRDVSQLNVPTGTLDHFDISKKFRFDTAIDYPHYPKFYRYPFAPIEDKDYLKGNLRSLSFYDSNNVKIKQIEYIYNFDNKDILRKKAQRLDFVVNENHMTVLSNLVRNSYMNYDDYINNSISNPVRCNGNINSFISTYLQPSDLLDIEFNVTRDLAFFTNLYAYKVQIEESKEKRFFYDGTESLNPNTNEVIPHPNNVVTTTQEFEYNSSNYLPSQTITTDSKGDVLKSKTYYSVSSPPLGFNYQDGTVKAEMASANIITTPLAKETYLNDELTSKVEYVHVKRTPSTNDFVLDKVYSSKGDEDLEPRLTYHLYDDYGNILDVSKKDGTHVSYIWGHNKTLPIAKIEGLSYEQLAYKLGLGNNLAALDNLNDSHLDIIAPGCNKSINDLRTDFTVENPFMVTTYVYEVGIGIKEVTDPRGRKMTYFYDDFNRLKYVEDHDGNRLSENEYKYATQN